MPKNPLVSIIIVNYNGKHFLKDCLRSLAVQTFPRDEFEVILVDNNSWDISVPYVKEHFPWVRVVKSNINLGFAGGNNLGVKYARGKYVALLNNDTSVPRNWLKPLVDRLEKDERIAAVNSKTLLRFPFMEISIKSDTFAKADFTETTDFRSVGVLLENIVLSNTGLQPLVHYRTGFYEREKGTIASRWTNGDARVLIPFDLNDHNISVIMTIAIRSQKSAQHRKVNFSVMLGAHELLKDSIESIDVKQYVIKIPQELAAKSAQYEVQNAGNVIFKNGQGRDRGTASTKSSQIFELDSPFYNEATEIQAFCGVSVLIRKDVFVKLGGFDESFFMYFEDADLSILMRKMGYIIFYEPKSVAYHLHSGSSIEWSPFFSYHAERNHLAFVIKHFPLSVVVIQSIHQVILFLYAILQIFKWGIKASWHNYEKWEERLEYRKNILIWIFANRDILLKKRREIAKKAKVPMASIYKQLY